MFHRNLSKLIIQNQILGFSDTIKMAMNFPTNPRTRVRHGVRMRHDMNTRNKMLKPCGAKTRQGTPCKNTRLYKNGRCMNHGGLSTGPRTEEGKA